MYAPQLTVLLLLSMSSVLSQGNEDDWLDPNDMINFDHSAMKMKNKPQQNTKNNNEQRQHTEDNPKSSSGAKQESLSGKPTEKKKEKDFISGAAEKQEMCKSCPSAVPLLKDFTRSLLKHLDKIHIEAGYLDLKAFLSASDVNALRKFATKDGNLMDAHNVLLNMILTASIPQEYSRKEWIEEKLGISLKIILQGLAICTLAVALIYLEVKLNITWRRKILKLCVLLFFLSVPWTWYELYKKEEIKQHAAVMKNVPKECLQKESEMGYYELTKSVLQSWFSLKEDKCHTYYEHVLIDPMWKVTPTQAFAVTFVRFFVSPLRYIGEAVSQFLVGVLKDLPVQLWPVAGVFVSVLLFFLFFMGFGYRVRLPLISVEPAPVEGNASKLQALLDVNEKYFKQIEELKESVKLVGHNVEQITFEESHDRPTQKVTTQRMLTSDDVVDLFNKLSDRKKNEKEHLAIKDSKSVNERGDDVNLTSEQTPLPDSSVDTIGVECDK